MKEQEKFKDQENQEKQDTQQNADKGANSKPNNKKHGKNGRSNKNKGDKNTPRKNDYTFYAADEQIAKDAASIPFNYIGGSRYPISVSSTVLSVSQKTRNINRRTSTKGIVSLGLIKYVPSIGITEAVNEGVNMAFRQLYAYVRKVNSGARNYEVADMGMYVLALEEIYREFLENKRIIGLADRYHFYNHNIPYVFALAENIDYNDLVANAADYRRQLNIIAKKINSYAMPKYFSSFKRRAFVSSYVFSDSTSPRGQFYMFKSTGYYKWEPRVSEQGTQLTYVHKDFDLVTTMQDRLDILNEMIDAISQDEDATTISGDLLKAFPQSELYELANTDENYFTEIMYDEDVLGQIENARFVCETQSEAELFDLNATKNNRGEANTGVFDVIDFNITQSGQLISFKPKFSIPLQNYVNTGYYCVKNFEDVVFNSHKDNPDYRDVLEWSRLIPTFESDIDFNEEQNNIGTILKTITSSGLEIPMYMEIFRADYSNGPSLSYEKTIFSQVINGDDPTALTYWSNPFLAYYALMQMDWHPVLYYSRTNVDTNPIELGFDSKVTTLISNRVVKRINTTAIYGSYFAKQLFNQVK